MTIPRGAKDHDYSMANLKHMKLYYMHKHKERFKYLINTITRFRPTSDAGQGRIFLGAQVITCNGLFIGSKSNG